VCAFSKGIFATDITQVQPAGDMNPANRINRVDQLRGFPVAYEYKVVPAPKKGKRGNGLRKSEDKFAHALAEVMNELGAEGWEYLRSDTLPVEARSGLTGKTTTFQNMLIFQRIKEDTQSDPEVVSVEEITPSHAPLLPSAAESQDIPEHVSAETAPINSPREVAAE